MSDSEKYNDPLEELFRKKAEEYHLPYREEDWLKLEKKLELQDTRRFYRNTIRWVAAAAVFIIALLSYFTLDNHQRLNELNRQLSEEIRPPGILPQITPDGSQEESDRDTAPIDDQITTVLEPPITPPTSSTDAEEIHQHHPSATPLLASEGDKKRIHSGLHVAKQTALPHTLYQPTEVVVDQQFAQVSHTETYDHAETKPSRFSLSMHLAPEFSSISGPVSGLTEPGYRAGITISYHVTEQLSISTGIIQNISRYTGSQQTYQFNNSIINADEMSGTCRILDIPLRFVYDFTNSGFFASAGISSYIMLNEAYKFDYTEYNQIYTYEWEDRTGSRHWMSNATISAGYELPVHTNWDLRLEPFISVPLREVGRANVRLYSVGSYVSLRYRL